MSFSIEDNAKLFQKLKSGLKRTINWNKCQSKLTILAPNTYLDYLPGPSFQGINRPFVLSFEKPTDKTVHTKFDYSTVEIKDYNVTIDGQNFFDQPVKNDLRTYDNIWKIATSQGYGYMNSCLLDYNYFN